MPRILILSVLLLFGQAVSAETADVKYHRKVPLATFACVHVQEGSSVNRTCYDKAERYMLIRLNSTYYHYCDIDPVTVQGLRAASSKRQFFQNMIRGSGSDGPFDCRTKPIPKKYGG